MEYNIEELFVLVKELTDIYTSKESTSITYEAAQQLMDAVLYCIRENDLEIEYNGYNETMVSNHVKYGAARESYENGYSLVVGKSKKAREIYNDIIVDFNDYKNRGYYDTVIKGMPEFFKWYDPRLKPMNHIITLDYSVLEPIYDLEGVDLIYRYLLCIQMEQKFLKQFPEEYVRNVLLRYHSDYEELLINICGVILKKVLVNMIMGVKLEKINFEQGDYEKLSKIINNNSAEQLEAKLYFNLQKLIANIYYKDQQLYSYVANEVPNILTEIKNAASNNSLCNII